MKISKIRHEHIGSVVGFKDSDLLLFVTAVGLKKFLAYNVLKAADEDRQEVAYDRESPWFLLGGKDEIL